VILYLPQRLGVVKALNGSKKLCDEPLALAKKADKEKRDKWHLDEEVKSS
jgi:hypothetical protein